MKIDIRFFLIGSFIILGGCSKSEITVEGHWYMIDSDSVYHELSFGKEDFVVNYEVAVGFPSMHYLLIDSSVYLYAREPKDTSFLLKVLKVYEDSMNVEIHSKQEVLKRFDLGYDPFKKHQYLSLLEKEIMFENRMENRKLILGIENFTSVGNDSLIEVETDFENIE